VTGHTVEIKANNNSRQIATRALEKTGPASSRLAHP